MSGAQSMARTSPFGPVPSDWRVLRLGELTSLMTNGFVGTATTHYVVNGGVTYIQGFNVIDGGFNLFGIKQVSCAFHTKHQKSRLRPGDLLTIQTGDIGLSTVVPPTLAGSNCHALIISRFRQNWADARYYMRLFNSETGRQVLRRIETGTTMKHLNVGDMLNLVVPVPPLKQQIAIADSIDSISDLITSFERLIAKKQAIKQGMMQQLLNGSTRLPGFKGPWQVVTLGDLGKTYGGLSGKSAADFGSGNAKFITFMNVMSNVRIDLAELAAVRVSGSEKQNAVAAGDVLFNGSSETPEELALASVVASVPPRTYLNSFCFGFRPHSSEAVDSLLLAYLFRGSPGRNLMQALAQGSTRYNLSKAQFRRLAIQMPGLDEQVAIAQCLGDADDELAALQLRLAKAKAIKQGMMQELLTGRTYLLIAGEAS
jgi:type I restriction enzyme S subunit